MLSRLPTERITSRTPPPTLGCAVLKNPILRLCGVAVAVIGLAVAATAITDSAPAHDAAGASRVRTDLIVPRHNVPISIEGFNETWAAYTAKWYAGAHAAELARAAAAAEESARRARDSAANATTSRVSATTRSYSSSAQFDDAAFDRVARCETGGNWSHQTQFDGGLGILHANWIHWGGTQFAPYGSQASREQQIVVARRLIADVGYKGWGCWRAFFG